MRSFFKIFFASLLALIIFTIITIFFLVGWIGGIASKNAPVIESKSVLVFNLGQHYKEQVQENPLSTFSGDDEKDIPGLYDVIRLMKKAETDNNISVSISAITPKFI